MSGFYTRKSIVVNFNKIVTSEKFIFPLSGIVFVSYYLKPATIKPMYVSYLLLLFPYKITWHTSWHRLDRFAPFAFTPASFLLNGYSPPLIKPNCSALRFLFPLTYFPITDFIFILRGFPICNVCLDILAAARSHFITEIHFII